ncbi:MAG: proton-conducting transporter membrane subunit [Bacteroidia bacterium]|nr:proton-conducting transporter membrane subunit [Bacteroidia bacterium]
MPPFWILGALSIGCAVAWLFTDEPLLQASLEITAAVGLYIAWTLPVLSAKGRKSHATLSQLADSHRAAEPLDSSNSYSTWGPLTLSLLYACSLSLALIGVALFIQASHPILLFAGWEAVSLAGWLLIAFARGISRRSLEAAFIAFLTNRVGDAFWIAGVFSEGKFVIGVWIGILVKAGLFPFTFWLIQAMFAPAAVSALLHSAVIVGLGAYMPLKYPSLTGTLPTWGINGLWLMGVMAGIGAVFSRTPKSILAWTTSAHLAVALFLSQRSSESVFYLLHHSYLKAALFLLLGLAQKQGGFSPILTVAWILSAFLLEAGHSSMDSWLWPVEILTAIALGRVWCRTGIRSTHQGVSAAVVVPLFLGGRVFFLNGTTLQLSGEAMLVVAGLGLGLLYRQPVRFRLEAAVLSILAIFLQGWLRFGRWVSDLEKSLDIAMQCVAKWVVDFGKVSAESDRRAAGEGWRWIAARVRQGLGFLSGANTPLSYTQGLSWGFLITLMISMLWRLLR